MPHKSEYWEYCQNLGSRNIILESFFCYVSVIRPQGYYITLNFDTFFFRVYAHLFTSKVF